LFAETSQEKRTFALNSPKDIAMRILPFSCFCLALLLASCDSGSDTVAATTATASGSLVGNWKWTSAAGAPVETKLMNMKSDSTIQYNAYAVIMGARDSLSASGTWSVSGATLTTTYKKSNGKTDTETVTWSLVGQKLTLISGTTDPKDTLVYIRQ
jgi:hypothetical protein